MIIVKGHYYVSPRSVNVRGESLVAISHPGRGVVRGAMAQFFFSPRFFLGTKIFGPKLGPVFFLTFYHYALWGKINGWIFHLSKILARFFFSEPMSGPIFFIFSDHPPPG